MQAKKGQVPCCSPNSSQPSSQVRRSEPRPAPRARQQHHHSTLSLVQGRTGGGKLCQGPQYCRLPPPPHRPRPCAQVASYAHCARVPCQPPSPNAGHVPLCHTNQAEAQAPPPGLSSRRRTRPPHMPRCSDPVPGALCYSHLRTQPPGRRSLSYTSHQWMPAPSGMSGATVSGPCGVHRGAPLKQARPPATASPSTTSFQNCVGKDRTRRLGAAPNWCRHTLQLQLAGSSGTHRCANRTTSAGVCAVPAARPGSRHFLPSCKQPAALTSAALHPFLRANPSSIPPPHLALALLGVLCRRLSSLGAHHVARLAGLGHRQHAHQHGAALLRQGSSG